MGKRGGGGQGYTEVLGSFAPVECICLCGLPSPGPGDQEDPGKQMGMREADTEHLF